MDVPNVKHVINYDLSSDIEEHIQCISHAGCGTSPGLVTSFFNYQNVNIARDLLEVLVEAELEVPSWLEDLAYEHQHKQRILALEQTLREERQGCERELSRLAEKHREKLQELQANHEANLRHCQQENALFAARTSGVIEDLEFRKRRA